MRRQGRSASGLSPPAGPSADGQGPFVGGPRPRPLSGWLPAFCPLSAESAKGLTMHF